MYVLSSDSLLRTTACVFNYYIFLWFSILQEIPRDYLLNRLGGVNTAVTLDVEHQGPSWREYITTTYHDAHHNAPKMDEHVSHWGNGLGTLWRGWWTKGGL
jgi:hypothetical protein